MTKIILVILKTLYQISSVNMFYDSDWHYSNFSVCPITPLSHLYKPYFLKTYLLWWYYTNNLDLVILYNPFNSSFRYKPHQRN